MRILSLVLGFLTYGVLASAETITGTVIKSDTGQPLPSVTVVAAQKGLSASQRPVLAKSTADSLGKFTLVVPPGQYTICTSGGGTYLDPCQWGGANVVTLATGSTAVADLRLEKGQSLTVRLHDSTGVLSQPGTSPGETVTVVVTIPGRNNYFLPVIYRNERILDLGASVPVSTQTRVVVSSGKITLSDTSGSALPAAGLVAPAVASNAANLSTSQGTLGFFHTSPQEEGTFVHVYSTGVR
jgi:hypothetical protein